MKHLTITLLLAFIVSAGMAQTKPIATGAGLLNNTSNSLSVIYKPAYLIGNANYRFQQFYFGIVNVGINCFKGDTLHGTTDFDNIRITVKKSQVKWLNDTTLVIIKP